MVRWEWLATDGRHGARCPLCGSRVRWNTGYSDIGRATCTRHPTSSRVFTREDLEAGRIKFCNWVGDVRRIEGKIYIMHRVDEEGVKEMTETGEKSDFE